MRTYTHKAEKEKKSSAAANVVANTQKNERHVFLTDNRSGTVAQTKINNSVNNYSGQQIQSVQKKENKTGLPDNLKSGIENLSGVSMDNVKVYYNSGNPAQLNAHAYAQGTDIHVAPGQEKHLPHEAWHVVQQNQGRVRPTMQLKGNININNDRNLENEADTMGARSSTHFNSTALDSQFGTGLIPLRKVSTHPKPIQAVWRIIKGSYCRWDGSVDGLQWYSHKLTGKMYYTIADESQIPHEEIEYYKKMEGALLPLNSWLSNEHWQQGKWEESDREVVGKEVEEADDQVKPHEGTPVAKWKFIGHKNSKRGTMEAVIRQLYLLGENKNIDTHLAIDKLKKLRKLGPEWEELAADPSLMLKPGIFTEFVKSLDPSVKDPWEARKRYAKTLGASKVYRAIWVDPDVIKGIEAKVKKEHVIMPGRCAELSDACDCTEVLNNIEITLSEHVQGEDDAAGLYQSVTSDPKIAEAVANRTRISGQRKAMGVFMGLQDWERKKIFLIEAQIPNIDLFYVGDLNKNFDNFIVDLNREDVHWPIPYGKAAEQIVLGNIKGVQIISIKEIEDPTGRAETRSK